MANNTGFGDFLSNALLTSGMSSSELARKSGVSQAAISRWLSGKREPKLDSFLAILDALGLEMRIAEKGSGDGEA